MKLEKVKKIRKIAISAVIAGVVASQVAPAASTGLKVHANTEGERSADDLLAEEKKLEQEEAARKAEEAAKKKAAEEEAARKAAEEEAARKATEEKAAENDQSDKESGTDTGDQGTTDTGSQDSGSGGQETPGSDQTGDSGNTDPAGDQTGEEPGGGTEDPTPADPTDPTGEEPGNTDPAMGEDTPEKPNSTDPATGEDDPEEPGNTDPATGEDDTEKPADTDPDDGTSDGKEDGKSDDQKKDDKQSSDDTTGDDTKKDGKEEDGKTGSSDSVKKDKKQKNKKDKDKKEKESEQTKNRPETFEQNEQQVAVPTGEIVPSPIIYRGFRFWTIAKDRAFASANLSILEEKDSASRVIGTLRKDGLCYLLKEEQDGWYYVESGDVRGFVQTDKLLIGEDAQPLLEKYQTEADANAEEFQSFASVDTTAPMAYEIISRDENEAFDYYRATVYQTVVQKDYALPAKDMVNIREEASKDGRVVGVLSSDSICYIIADRNKRWMYVESGDVRGFVRNEDVIKAKKAGDDSILTKDDEDYAEAQKSIEPEENAALYYTITSTQSGVPSGMQRTAILQYASQFIGNPYVWGGTSLTHGADCSGFVQSIFAQYGYSLPRISGEQARVGTKIPVEDALPGDLIFYGNGDHIYHVVIYAGDGTTIEAKSRKYGIVSGKVSYSSAAWAVRIIDEKTAMRYEIPQGLGSVHTYMGWQKVTNPGSQQYAFRQAAGMTFDPEGFAVVDNRYVIACTTTFGAVGDYVDFYQDDGTVIPCVIGDIKSQNDPGCNVYGHDNGRCIVEFVVDQNSWYGTGHANPGTASCHPEWNHNIVKVENVGSFYD